MLFEGYLGLSWRVKQSGPSVRCCNSCEEHSVRTNYFGLEENEEDYSVLNGVLNIALLTILSQVHCAILCGDTCYNVDEEHLCL